MKESTIIKDDILNILSQNISDIDFENAYQRKNSFIPIKKTVGYVGVTSDVLEIHTSDNVQTVIEQGCSILITLLAPLKYGGHYCSEILSDIVKIIGLNLNESAVKITSGSVSYDSNSQAFCGEIKITIGNISSKTISEPFTNNIHIVLNGQDKYINTFNIDVTHNYFDVLSYGEHTPITSLLKDSKYTLTLKTSIPFTNIFKNQKYVIYLDEQNTFENCFLTKSFEEIENNLHKIYTYVFLSTKKRGDA